MMHVTGESDTICRLLPFHGSAEAASDHVAPQACLTAATHKTRMLSSCMPMVDSQEPRKKQTDPAPLEPHTTSRSNRSSRSSLSLILLHPVHKHRPS